MENIQEGDMDDWDKKYATTKEYRLFRGSKVGPVSAEIENGGGE